MEEEEEKEEEEEESCQQQYVYCSDLTCTSHCSILSVVFFFFFGSNQLASHKALLTFRFTYIIAFSAL